MREQTELEEPMWDAFRKIFRHDDAPEDTTVTQERPSQVAPSQTAPMAEAAHEPTPQQAEVIPLEVMPPEVIPPLRQEVSPQAVGDAVRSAPVLSARDDASQGDTSDAAPPPVGGMVDQEWGPTIAAVAPTSAAGPAEVSPPEHAPQGLAADASAPAATVAGADVTPGEQPREGMHPPSMLPAAEGPATGAAADVGAAGGAVPGSTMEPSDSPLPVTSSIAPDALPGVPAVEAAPVETALQGAAGAPDAVEAGAEMAPTLPQAASSSVGAEPVVATTTGEALASAVTAPEAQPTTTASTAPAPAALRGDTLAPAATEPTGPEAVAAADALAPTQAAPEQAPPEQAPPEQAVPAEVVQASAFQASATTVRPLEPGTVVGERYTITALADAAAVPDALHVYSGTDRRSFEQCWSCGSTDNTPDTRFCQNCGAPIQNHAVTLVETLAATGLPGEVPHESTYLHVQPERRLFGAEGVGIEIGAYSAEGPHHPNEDSYWYIMQTRCANSGRQSTAVALFADGMGGYAPGSGLISARIVDTAGTTISTALEGRAGDTAELTSAEIEAIARAGIAAANDMVLREIARTGEMGATFVAAIVEGDTAYVANVGDSRAYYVDPRGRAMAITRDQSLVAQEVEHGELAEHDIYTAPGNNIILHAIGEGGVEQAADWYAQPLEPGSFLILCSDGYWKTMRGSVDTAVLRQGATLSEAARRMVENALAQGSDDNTTVLLIAIS